MFSYQFAINCALLLVLVGVSLHVLRLRKRCAQLTASLNTHQAVIEHTSQAMYSFRNIFDHYSNYTPVPPALDTVMFEISTALGSVIQRLPRFLPAIQAAYPDQPERFEALLDELTLKQSGQFVEIRKALAEINDPVLNELWSVRTPTALTEMLRHSLFLSFGYGQAVSGDWSPEGIGIELPPMRDPGYVNWGAGFKANLRKKHMRLWSPPHPKH